MISKKLRLRKLAAGIVPTISFAVVALVAQLAWAPHVDSGESVPSDLESPSSLQKSLFVKGKLAKGNYHTVLKEVGLDGNHTRYTVDSIFGRYEVTSLALLKIRVQEINTLAWAVELHAGESFLDSLKESVVQVPHAAAHTIVHPVASAKKFGQGVKEKVNRIVQGVKWRKKSEYEDPLIKSLLLSKEKRRLAYELKLDPYSSNPKTQELLDRLARARFGGTIPMRIVGYFVPTYASLTLTVLKLRAEVNRNLRDKTPGELSAMNNKKLEALGVEEGRRKAFLQHSKLSPRHKTAIVASLEALRDVVGVATFLNTLFVVEDEADALYAEKQAEMLVYYHKEAQPLRKLTVVGRTPVAVTEKREAVVLAPMDYGCWNAELKEEFSGLASHDSVAKSSSRELFVTGRFSPRARKELQALGFTLHEGLLHNLR